MRLALAQINPTIGDLAYNADLILERTAQAAREGADLVVFPELALCGYPPRDLLLRRDFLESCERHADRIVQQVPRAITVVFGLPIRGQGGSIHNALLATRDSERTLYVKRLLPTYDVFDEDRYFTPGNRPTIVEVPTRSGKTRKVGLSICEDLWKGQDAGFAARYAGVADPVPDLVAAGAEIIVNPSASPFVLGKGARHRAILRDHAVRHGVYVAAVNQVGGNDELIFDGHAAVLSPQGVLLGAGPGFAEAVTIVDLSVQTTPRPVPDPLLSGSEEELAFRALVLGIRDYCRKTGFSAALIGLSGGIDSALTAVLAAAALGPANVTGIAMPGPFSSDHSLADAAESARALGIRHEVMPITGAFESSGSGIDRVLRHLDQPALGQITPDLAEENLQSRLRGTMLMAISNRTGAIVLTTGNKSESAVGYCTLYGDMNGGLAVLSDVTKALVYRLSRWINANPDRLGITGLSGLPIPPRSIDKPPSAELRPNQTDQDSLPPYDVLDRIIELAVEQHASPDEIERATGFAPDVVRRVCRMIDLSEYKRRQAATGLKLTSVAFGSGRRMPIAQRYRPWASPPTNPQP